MNKKTLICLMFFTLLICAVFTGCQTNEAKQASPVEETISEDISTQEESSEETLITEEILSENTTDANETVNEENSDVAASESAPVEDTQTETDTVIVANVDGNEITSDSFQKMAVFTRYQYLSYYYNMLNTYSMYGIPFDEINNEFESILGEEGKEALGGEIIDQLVYNELLNKEADAQGLSITDKDIVNKLKSLFQYDEEAESSEQMILGIVPSDVTMPEMDGDKDAKFLEYLASMLTYQYGPDLDVDFFKSYAKSAIQEEALFNKVLEGRVFEEEQVSARHILLEDENTAKEVLEKLENGEDWAELAAAYSMDTSNKDSCGDLGWFGKGVMVAPFEEAAFALEAGEITKEPVKTDFGYHIIASDGKEIRPLEDAALQAAQEKVFAEWNTELREKYPVELFNNWTEYLPSEPAFEPIVQEEPVEEVISEEAIVEEEAPVTEEVNIEEIETSDLSETEENTSIDEEAELTDSIEEEIIDETQGITNDAETEKIEENIGITNTAEIEKIEDNDGITNAAEDLVEKE